MYHVRRTGTARLFHCVLFLGLCILARPSLADTTLTFDNLSGATDPTQDYTLTAANGGSRVISGITFNAAANSDWEVIGNQFQAPSSSDAFLQTHSGNFALAGNTFTGTDFSSNPYNGLTVSTNRVMTGLYVGFDDNGGGSNDADSLTVTAFGSGGDLGSVNTALNGPALSFLDTSAFSGLSGITGYRFETTASNALYAAFGQAYLIADDLTFAPSAGPVPEPSPLAVLALGLAGLTVLALRRRAAPQS